MAAKKFENLLETFQGNAYPGMVEDLARHLGVTSESIYKIAPGWAPVVQFKKGLNYQGWWVIPERDAEANVIGLSLRSQSDTKVMYPGGKHGLIYQVNPEHQNGAKGYEAGAHNWIRTMDAGVLCPVCGKPDGCLLSADNAEDPKAAVCIRTPSDKQLRFGYLHVLRSEGLLTGRSALVDNGGPVIIVEGASDAFAAFDLGFDGVGRPSNLACMDLLADLVRGRTCWVIGENDRKSDGKEPGKEGMIAAFQQIRHVTRDSKHFLPPEHIKDLRAWKVKYGLTREQLLAYAESNGLSHSEELVLGDDRPLTIARSYLSSTHRMGNRSTLKRWGQTWYLYDHGRYAAIDQETFIQPLYHWSQDKLVQKVTANGSTSLTPFVANRGSVGNVEEAIIADTLIPTKKIPCWINGASGPDPSDLIVFQNGILHVSKFLEGRDDYFLDPTPDLFTTAAMPFAFDPTATCPEWKKFLRTSLGDCQNKIMLLREWMGYCMTTDRKQQKMMFMRGPSAAGKGTIIDLMVQMMGEQAAATSFTELAGPFGLQPLLGKTVCVIGDARTPKNTDVMRGLELLLNIVGNDYVSVNRKNKDQIDLTQMMCRITIASNEFLDVPDHANAMLRRLLILEFKHSFSDSPQRDNDLPFKLSQEIAGIALWALEGLRRLRQNGSFTVPTSMNDALMEWRVATNPMAGFVEECCDVNSEHWVTKNELYDAWTGWSVERRFRPITRSRFYERMRTAAPSTSTETHEISGSKIGIYRGIRLKPWASRQFTGKP